MTALRLLRCILHLCLGLAICLLIFPLTDHAGRQAHIRRWSAQLLRLCQVRMVVEQAGQRPLEARALIVANHVSWLDIFVINSLQPCRFVAKADIRDWPLIGFLCQKVGTIFISRGKLREVRKIYQDLVSSLRAGERVAFFPEGTTVAQGSLLPFHSNLFEAAIEAGVPVQPYAVSYFDPEGNLHPAVDFVGDMNFARSMLTILKARGITARLTILPAIHVSVDTHRRELAQAAQAVIAAELGHAPAPHALPVQPPSTAPAASI